MDEARVAVGHGVVFEAALAALAVVAAVLHRHRDERRDAPGRILRVGQVVERVLHQADVARPVLDDEDGRRGAVLVLRRHVHRDGARRVDRLAPIEGRVLAVEDGAARQRHRKLEALALGRATIRRIRLRRVARPDHEVAVAFVAGIGIGAPALAAATGRVPHPAPTSRHSAARRPGGTGAGRSTAGAGDRSARPGDTAPATGPAAVAPSARRRPAGRLRAAATRRGAGARACRPRGVAASSAAPAPAPADPTALPPPPRRPRSRPPPPRRCRLLPRSRSCPRAAHHCPGRRSRRANTRSRTSTRQPPTAPTRRERSCRAETALQPGHD